MNILKKIIKKFKKNYICPKCNDPTYGEDLCSLCREYNRLTRLQQKMDAEAKEDLKRRDWIKHRNIFLKENNG